MRKRKIKLKNGDVVAWTSCALTHEVLMIKVGDKWYGICYTPGIAFRDGKSWSVGVYEEEELQRDLDGGYIKIINHVWVQNEQDQET